jgi:two-component system sensor histidine kinase BaeS
MRLTVLKLPLVWKMVLINLLSVGLVTLIVALAIHYLAVDYFMTLVKQYKIAPEEAHAMFLDSIHRYLLMGSLVGGGCATALSFWLTRRTLNPLDRIRLNAGKISRGDYSARVEIEGCGEVAELATAFNHMAKNLRHTEQLRKDLVVNVAHELRTPLTNIRGYIEALLDGVIPPSAELYESLQEETFRLVKLVDDLLQLTRADAAKNTLRLEPACLTSLVGHALDLFRLKFSTKGIQLDEQLPPSPLESLVDADKLNQVMINLLENAWRYTPHQGRVSLSIERYPQSNKVTIRNSVEQQTLEHAVAFDQKLLFERFYRFEQSRSREYGGAGIGLAIVKELVEAHGGSVGGSINEVEANFWFLLPSGTKTKLP